MRQVQFWTGMNGFPGGSVDAARQAEEAGWDGIGVPDSQSLSGDPYVALSLAARHTSTLLLRTNVTNPLTRHPAVTATSIATVQAESNGRAILGIGRGDSALAHLGLAPAPLKVFERYVERVQGYLRGEDVPFDLENDGRGQISASSALELGDGPEASRLRWLRYAHQPKVPVDVAASGPRVIDAAGRLADAVTFAVGADPQRIAWAIDRAKGTRSDAGFDPSTLVLGAAVPVAVSRDRKIARSILRPGFATYARFSVMHGFVVGPVSDAHRQTLEAIHDNYDMKKHTTQGRHTEAVTDEIIDTFAIAGPPSYCVERLAELIELGITSLMIQMGGGRGTDDDAARSSRHAFHRDVMPALRQDMEAIR
jgi:5,10-methylenetetrahydromethanopterin reductase